MVRLIGAVMVVAAGAYIGIAEAAALRRRVQILRGFETALSLLGGEVAERLTPLNEAALLLSESSPPSVAAFFTALSAENGVGETFAARWLYGLEGFHPPLSPPEHNELRRLGQILGRYSAAYQGGMIDQTRQRLSELAADAEHDAASRGKVFASMGLCGGLFAAILLL